MSFFELLQQFLFKITIKKIAITPEYNKVKKNRDSKYKNIIEIETENQG